VLLRSILKTWPSERRCLKRCRCCRIFILTDPRNTGRKDLRCPFGCQQAHEKQESTRRSVAWYRTAKGKERKRVANRKRNRTTVPGKPRAKEIQPAEPTDATPTPGETGLDPVTTAQESSSQRLKPGPWPRPMVKYVRVVVSLIERRKVSLEQIHQMLVKIWRQRGMARRRKVDHIVERLNERAP